MTTFQDPQPQSRRAVRQSERGQNDQGAESPTAFTQFPASAQSANEQPAAPQFFDQDAPREMWDTTNRRAAQLAAAAPPSPDAQSDAPASGRRAAAAAANPAPVAEPLSYATQSKPAIPSYDGPTFRPRAVAAQAPSPDLPPTQAIPKVDQPSYRVRDFSPEGRRSAPASGPVWEATVPASDLNYQTQNRPLVREVPAAVAPQPVLPIVEQVAEPVAEQPHEHTLSRREMRAMLQSEQPSALVEPAPVQAQAPAAPPVEPAAVAPTFVEPVFEAPEAFVAPAPEAAPQSSADFSAAPVVDSQEATVFPFSLAAPTPAAVDAPIVSVGDTAAPEQNAHTAPEAAVAPQHDPFDFSRAPEPVVTPALSDAITEFDQLAGTANPAPVEPASPESAAIHPAPVQQPPSRRVEDAPTGVWTPPVGHWSTQADLEDESQVYENTLSRTLGTGGLTTSALVLPTIPQGSDIRGALTGTGEIMLTGSIDLPQSYSTTGVHDRFEHGGIDSLFDASDADVVSTDSAPVRAIRAVSTHNTSGHGVTHTQKPKGTRSLTALLIAAASMAVVVAGLLVTAIAFNVF